MTGTYEHSIDAKGRLFIPAKLREELGVSFYLAMGIDTCLAIYPQATWDKFTEKFASLPMTQSKVMRPLFANAVKCELDSQGRIVIPQKLREETTEWLSKDGRTTGYLFLNRFGERITTRGISQQLKNYAEKYGMNPKVVYPHSFRHRFAKNFLDKYNDIALLADLMGHESIETTRIYLRKSSLEQQAIVDKIITW